MSDVKWIKIVVDIFDDEKIKLLEAMPDGDAIVNIWLKLLCLAGKQNCNGFLMISERLAYTDEMLSVIFRKPVNTVRLALDAFEGFGMIQRTDIGAISITNWEKHQNLDAFERMKESNKNRQAAFRQRKALKSSQNFKALAEGSNVTDNVTDNVTVTDKLRDGSVTVTPLDIDIDIDKDINNICIEDQSSTQENTSKVRKRKSTLSEKQKELFDKFYSAYPKKRSVGEAEKAWKQITPDPDDAFVDRLIRSVRSKQESGEWSDFQYIPFPASWLRARGWEDDITLPVSGEKPKKTAEQIAAEREAYQREIELSERMAPKFI